MKAERHRRGIFPLVGSVLILALLLLGPAASRWQARQERAQRYGVYSQAQVEARAAALCRALGGRPDKLFLTVSHTEGHTVYRGRDWMRWEAVYDDRSGWTRCSLMWDAATGRLYSAAACYPLKTLRDLPGHRRRSDAALVCAARQWTNLLVSSPLSPDWSRFHVIHYPALTQVALHRPGETAYISLSKDGRLFLAAKIAPSPT